ncbi:MAG: hypothetical protein DWQ34_03285 [Planctomycetota bacterium]|nr:MAG: hypothetical protein DWQ34_03285 [Planctomycetota bacterium]REK25591.1 MAG: hypothetical protein DWQ41_11690 [Planctomycetota bacterium]REK31698.1 MAG: hypothetical protein DWQ45_18995 [Planctomycetota bacterium]
MTASTWTESDTAKAEQIWSDFREQHDLSDSLGKTAGIDPQTGRVWIGESIQDVLSQRDADGVDSLLFFERIGSETYYRKGAGGDCGGCFP